MKVVIGLVFLGVLLGFGEKWYTSQRCEKVEIVLEDSRTPLLARKDIEMILSEAGKRPLEGRPFRQMDLNYLESRVESNPLVKDCQISRNLKGSLEVRVITHQPIARLIQPDLPDNGMDRYLNEEGRFMPLSERSTARVLLLSGPYFERKNTLRAARDSSLLSLIRQIDQDSLWRAQIGWMEVDRQGEVTMWPQVGDVPVEFGPAAGRDAKFKKMKTFFRQILPLRGWSSYSKVSVKYQNQIVCTKVDTLKH